MILTDAKLITLWDKQPLVEGALIAIEGKTIIDFGKVGKLIDRYDDTDVLDVGGRVVMPGLINAHSHLWRRLAPGLPAGGSGGFRELQEKFWWKFERALGNEDIYMSAMVGLLDSVRSGVTAVVDHHSSSRALNGSLDFVWRAFSEIGVRGCLSYGVSDRDGEAVAVAGIDENRRFLERCLERKSDAMAGSFGLDSSSAVSDKTLARAIEATYGLGQGFHTHLAEDPTDVADTRTRDGKSPLHRLAAQGVLGKRSLAVHCIHMDNADYHHLKRSEAAVVHCPQSNAAGAVGVGDLGRMISTGIPVAMGTDGFALSLFEEFRAAVLQQRFAGRSLSEAMELGFCSAFGGNADLATLLFGPPLGRIKPGARADLLVVDYDPPVPFHQANLVDHLFTGLSRASIRTVIIDGKFVLKDGVFPGLDEPRIRARAREVAKRLWESL